MKTLQSLIVLFFSIFVLSSCNQEQAELSSRKGDLTITVNATRYVIGDPWLVTVELKMTGIEQIARAEREIVASEISDKNVEFNWQDDKTCIVVIEQRDGSLAQIPVRVR